MTALDRTAYPRFKRRINAHELQVAYTPTPDEIAFAHRVTRSTAHRFLLLVQLKVFQCLGHFPSLAAIPPLIVAHIRTHLGLPDSLPLAYTHDLTRHRHRHLIRDYLGVQRADRQVRQLAVRTALDALVVKDHPADVINVVVEELIRQSCELPPFATLDRLVRHARMVVNRRLCAAVVAQIPPESHGQLTALLTSDPQRGRSPFNALKAAPQRPTITHLHDLLEYHDWVWAVGDPTPWVRDLAPAKIAVFAAHARALDAHELTAVRDPKRTTLLVCLLTQVQAHTRDHLVDMFLKQMARIHQAAERALDRFQEQSQATTEDLLTTFAEVLHSMDPPAGARTTGNRVRRILGSAERIQRLRSQCETLLAYRDQNYLPLVADGLSRTRTVLFRLIRTLPLVASSTDQRVLTAVRFLRERTGRQPTYYPATLSLTFTTEKWRRIVQVRRDGHDLLVRRHLEACVFSALAEELRVGNICVPASATYGDMLSTLLTWEDCESRLPAYTQALGFPTTPTGFVDYLRTRLTQVAHQVDRAYPTNPHLTITAQGEPQRHKYPPTEMPDSAKALEARVIARMPERSVLEILHRTACRTHWTRHFGPVSGAEPKLAAPQQRYLLTTFTYGCHLGPTQAARHMRGEITAHQLSYTNQRHVRSSQLYAALTDLINTYHQCTLPHWWGAANVVATDGTHYQVRKNTLTSEYHIRYGSSGGIAYHHVSGTYVLLISQFIPCGAWEAIYIVAGLQKNQSDIQPDTVHADTQGQSLPVFALCFLWGITLLPRIRNWKDLIFYRPSRDTTYTHIDALFRGTIDWDIIHTHCHLLWRMVLSIQSGNLSSVVLLRRLRRGSHRNHFYRVVCEVGKVIRTEALLRFLADGELQASVTATTNKVESFHRFSQWLRFGDDPMLIASHDPEEQEKAILYQDVVANAVMVQNVLDMTRIIRTLIQEGYPVTRADVAHLSPYLTQHIRRFGDYVIDGLNDPVADVWEDPTLEV